MVVDYFRAREIFLRVVAVVYSLIVSSSRIYISVQGVLMPPVDYVLLIAEIVIDTLLKFPADCYLEWDAGGVDGLCGQIERRLSESRPHTQESRGTRKRG